MSEAVDPPKLEDGDEIIRFDILVLTIKILQHNVTLMRWTRAVMKAAWCSKKKLALETQSKVFIKGAEICENRGLTKRASAFGQMVLSMSCVHSGTLDSAPISGIIGKSK